MLGYRDYIIVGDLVKTYSNSQELKSNRVYKVIEIGVDSGDIIFRLSYNDIIIGWYYSCIFYLDVTSTRNLVIEEILE